MSAIRFIERDGAGLRVSLEGEGGTPLVLVHEMGGALESWDRLMPHLADRRVLRLDMRGFGMATKVSRVNSLDAMADDIAFALDAAEIAAPVDLSGMAVGAAAALRFATRHPQRTRALVLAGPALGVAEEKRAPLLARADRIETGGMAAIAEEELGFTYPPALRAEEAFSTYRARWLGNDPVSYAATCRMLAALDMRVELAALKTPTLLLAGTLDPLRPPSLVHTYAEAMPAADFEVVASGHVPAWQTPQDYAAALLRFLDAPERPSQGPRP